MPVLQSSSYYTQKDSIAAADTSAPYYSASCLFCCSSSMCLNYCSSCQMLGDSWATNSDQTAPVLLISSEIALMRRAHPAKLQQMPLLPREHQQLPFLQNNGNINNCHSCRTIVAILAVKIAKPATADSATLPAQLGQLSKSKLDSLALSAQFNMSS